MSFEDDIELRPPIKLYPATPKPFYAGAEDIPGNESKPENRVFLLTLLNLSLNSLKMLEKEKVTVDNSIWKGLEIDDQQSTSQYIKYIGQDENMLLTDWVGDLWGADFDSNGEAEAKITDCLPGELVAKDTGLETAVDFSAVWKEVGLDGSESYRIALQNKSYPKTKKGKFDFLLGLAETKRKIIHAFTGMGINLLDPNFPEAINDFQDNFDNHLRDAGALNIQILRDLIDMRLSIAQSLDTIVSDASLKEDILTDAKHYLAERIKALAGEISPILERSNSAKTSIDELKSSIGSDGRIKLESEGEDKEQKNAQKISSIKNLVGQIKNYCSTLQGSFANLKKDLEIVPLQLLKAISEIDLLGSSNSFPTNINAYTNFNALLLALSKSTEAFDYINTTLSTIKDNPSFGIDLLWEELKQPLSVQPLAEELEKTVENSFETEARKPIGYVVGISAVNTNFMITNKINEKRYGSQKEDKLQERIQKMRAEAKHLAKTKKQRNEAMQRIAAKAQEQKKLRTNQAKAKTTSTFRKGR